MSLLGHKAVVLGRHVSAMPNDRGPCGLVQERSYRVNSNSELAQPRLQEQLSPGIDLRGHSLEVHSDGRTASRAEYAQSGWSGWADSNCRPLRPERSALPLGHTPTMGLMWYCKYRCPERSALATALHPDNHRGEGIGVVPSACLKTRAARHIKTIIPQAGSLNRRQSAPD